jgi:putative molybdopterin biosynthesis protein
MADPFRQEQFLNVIDRDEAERRFRAALDLRPLGAESVALEDALGRVLAEDVIAPVDVPGFDRSNVDGFAVRAADTFGASEDRPIRLRLSPIPIAPGIAPTQVVEPGTACSIATGGMLPRGADAVVMIEHTDANDGTLIVQRPVAPGGNVSFAGSDIGRGETILRRGERLTSRETGVLAALGIASVPVIRQPRVAIISTGDELVPPGRHLAVGAIYDSNATVLADAVRELGGMPVRFGVVPDDEVKLRAVLREALACDVVLLSGGTSKGAGDISYRVLEDFGPPGIVVHGVALKPGKPICLAALWDKLATCPDNADKLETYPTGRRPVPVAVLPGFPTSAIFTFHEFLAPVIRSLAGLADQKRETIAARLALRVNSERGRTEYLLVGLVQNDYGLAAYPMGKGSGSVTAFSKADGFITIPRQQEYVEAGAAVNVQPLGSGLAPADLVVIGSHCVGLDYLLGALRDQGVRSKFIAVGSSGGLEACRRGECDIAGIHLLDPATNVYNKTLLPKGVRLLEGYGRMQGIVFRTGDECFAGKTIEEIIAIATSKSDCILINRNAGSGTRILIDQLLAGARPAGYLYEAKSHQAVAAAVAQGRADWGVAIAQVAADQKLSFVPVREERYDFAIPEARWDREPVRIFREIVECAAVRERLRLFGFVLEG